jgi:SpoVK/Ycf46/Vps4 family AAA+-type ATPase
VDDAFLSRAASSIPKHSIFLLEDIDCAFSSRDDDDADLETAPSFSGAPPTARKSSVTLSGLLNVIDGVGSEEGKLFFATTNYVDRLDPALLRPGRIDMKIPYHLASRAQAAALFTRFFPAESSTGPTSAPSQGPSTAADADTDTTAPDIPALRARSLASIVHLSGDMLPRASRGASTPGNATPPTPSPAYTGPGEELRDEKLSPGVRFKTVSSMVI